MSMHRLTTEVKEGILFTAELRFSITHEMLLDAGAKKMVEVICPSLLGQLEDYERELREKRRR